MSYYKALQFYDIGARFPSLLGNGDKFDLLMTCKELL